MKGYSLKRYCYSGHWSFSFVETLYYFPTDFPAEDIIIFIHQSSSGNISAGIASNPLILKEIKEYCDKCLSGQIPEKDDDYKPAAISYDFNTGSYLNQVNKIGSYLNKVNKIYSTKKYKYILTNGVEFYDFSKVDLPINFDIIKEIKQKQNKISNLETEAKELKDLFLKELKNNYGIKE